MLPSSPRACSLGRILDALSCYLGFSSTRTYDGEPAMRTERYLAKGELKYEFTTELKNTDRKIVLTLPLFEQLYEYIKNFELTERSRSDLAFSFVHKLMEEYVNIGIDAANEKGVNYIGFTGGVSYNLPIMKIVEKFVERSGLTFITHNRIPNGDGGISAGQNIIVGHLLKE
jgi:hydrogenase maturation protein HypF